MPLTTIPAVILPDQELRTEWRGLIEVCDEVRKFVDWCNNGLGPDPGDGMGNRDTTLDVFMVNGRFVERRAAAIKKELRARHLNSTGTPDLDVFMWSYCQGYEVMGDLPTDPTDLQMRTGITSVRDRLATHSKHVTFRGEQLCSMSRIVIRHKMLKHIDPADCCGLEYNQLVRLMDDIYRRPWYENAY